MLTILKTLVTSFAISDSGGRTISTVKTVPLFQTDALHSREARFAFTCIGSISTVPSTKSWWAQTCYKLGI